MYGVAEGVGMIVGNGVVSVCASVGGAIAVGWFGC